MSLILNIDTATETASICLARNESIIALCTNEDQKDHAAWIHIAIQRMLQTSGTKLNEIAAVGVTEGPGSYTGLRVGLSTAKGLCYALDIPLITENTLKVIALAGIEELSSDYLDGSVLICPMIDARRMEVFTALFDLQLHMVLPTESVVLHENSFREYLDRNKVIFLGSGSAKWKQVCIHPSAIFEPGAQNSSHLAQLSIKKFRQKDFADTVYTEPFYGKEFYTPKTPSRGR